MSQGAQRMPGAHSLWDQFPALSLQEGALGVSLLLCHPCHCRWQGHTCSTAPLRAVPSSQCTRGWSDGHLGGNEMKLHCDHITPAGPCSTACWLQTPHSNIQHLGEGPSEHISPDWDLFFGNFIPCLATRILQISLESAWKSLPKDPLIPRAGTCCQLSCEDPEFAVQKLFLS